MTPRRGKRLRPARLAAEAEDRQYERDKAARKEKERQECVEVARVCRGIPAFNIEVLEGLSRRFRVARREIRISRIWVKTDAYSGCTCSAVFSTPVGDYECWLKQNLSGVVTNACTW